MVLLPLLAFFPPFLSFGSCTMTRKPTQGAQSGNPTDDSRSAPEDEASSLSGPNVDRLREHYRIPEQFRLSALGAGGRVNNPPPGDLALYVEDLRAGLRLSIPEFVRNLLDYYGLCPAQLAPNSVRLIISFALLCQLLVMLSPTWRANLLRPIASSPDRREACTCKRKSALTGGGSGGDPPTVKSER